MCQKLKKSMHRLPSSAPETKCRHTDAGRTDGRTAGRTDIRGDANTPRPHFVGRGIKNASVAMFFYKLILRFKGYTSEVGSRAESPLITTSETQINYK